MNIVPAKLEHLDVLKSWFADKRSVRQWGGPLFRYPFTAATFLEDMRWQEMSAYSLLDGKNSLNGLGQYYERERRCHLARLIIDPARRGEGLGQYFIRGLMQIGMSRLGVDECSLFVMDSNQDAIRCYKSLQFVPTPHPSDDPLFENMSFMVYRRFLRDS